MSESEKKRAKYPHLESFEDMTGVDRRALKSWIELGLAQGSELGRLLEELGQDFQVDLMIKRLDPRPGRVREVCEKVGTFFGMGNFSLEPPAWDNLGRHLKFNELGLDLCYLPGFGLDPEGRCQVETGKLSHKLDGSPKYFSYLRNGKLVGQDGRLISQFSLGDGRWLAVGPAVSAVDLCPVAWDDGSFKGLELRGPLSQPIPFQAPDLSNGLGKILMRKDWEETLFPVIADFLGAKKVRFPTSLELFCLLGSGQVSRKFGGGECCLDRHLDKGQGGVALWHGDSGLGRFNLFREQESRLWKNIMVRVVVEF